MQVVVTRTPLDAAPWVDALQQAGYEVVQLPLIDITPVADTSQIVQLRRELPRFAAAMFVSGNAVAYFFNDTAGFGGRTDCRTMKTRMWATGPGTVEALLQVGWRKDQIDAPPTNAPQFDSETLWSSVRSQIHEAQGQPPPGVLIVRGEGRTRRDWLACQLEEAGAVVEYCEAYRRLAPDWNIAQRDLALRTAESGALWLFSSSEAVGNLLACIPTLNPRRVRCICTHPRIAATARALGFDVVCESRPTPADLVASIELVT